MKIQIEKEKRRTISLRLVDAENAIVKAPINYSQKQIDDFIRKNQKWLERAAVRKMCEQSFKETFNFNEFLYLFGEPVGRKTELIKNFSSLSEKRQQTAVKKFYLTHFSVLEKRVYEFSNLTDCTFDELLPCQSVCVWGKFCVDRRMKKTTMKLNWKLVVLPKELSDYVIIHELCHSKHMNHSPKFWQEVEKYCSNYKAVNKKLNMYGFLLKTSL